MTDHVQPMSPNRSIPFTDSTAAFDMPMELQGKDTEWMEYLGEVENGWKRSHTWCKMHLNNGFIMMHLNVLC